MTDDLPPCACIICQDYGDRDELDAIDRHTIANVGEHGWSVLQIPEDTLGPGWAFTVGLWHSHRQPELAVFGLDIETMKACLNVLGTQVADGWPAEPDHERSHVIDGDPVLFGAVDPRWYRAFFGTAIAFYRRPPVPFLQVLWADRDQRFPTGPDCDPTVRDRQPALWLPPDGHPKGVWTQDL
ncbi:DUF4262 domain-containing protein [Longispora sp. K20-0274]|uniref:DUF4262 domain-containing protein n=1 Tax=Longispora sp. K20-0274 TaxID=3088255 RepID=UPI00399BB475